MEKSLSIEEMLALAEKVQEWKVDSLGPIPFFIGHTGNLSIWVEHEWESNRYVMKVIDFHHRPSIELGRSEKSENKVVKEYYCHLYQKHREKYDLELERSRIKSLEEARKLINKENKNVFR